MMQNRAAGPDMSRRILRVNGYWKTKFRRSMGLKSLADAALQLSSVGTTPEHLPVRPVPSGVGVLPFRHKR